MPPPLNFTAILTVADESIDEISACLASFREHHHKAIVVIIIDGVLRPDVVRRSYTFNAVALQGEGPLKRRIAGGDWWHRFANWACDSGHDVILKIDPDTRFWRRFESFPDADFFGCVVGQPGVDEHVQGGCQGFRRTFLRRLIDSGLCWREELKDHAVYMPPGSQWPPQSLSTDFSMMWMAKQLDVKPQHWPEVFCRGGAAPPPAPGLAAATHPHKLVNSPATRLRDAKRTIALLESYASIAHRKQQIDGNQASFIAKSILRRPAGNVLIFGAGEDTRFWVRLNESGRTVVVEDDATWVNFARVCGATVLQVEYSCKQDQWSQDTNDPPMLPSLASLRDTTQWSAIIVDGPRGFKPQHHGREQSIQAASVLRGAGTAVFVHDYHRPWERALCDRYLGSPGSAVGSADSGNGVLACWT